MGALERKSPLARVDERTARVDVGGCLTGNRVVVHDPPEIRACVMTAVRENIVLAFGSAEAPCNSDANAHVLSPFPNGEEL